MDWLEFIKSVGFPIAACGFLAYYVHTQTIQYQEFVNTIIKFLEEVLIKEMKENDESGENNGVSKGN